MERDGRIDGGDPPDARVLFVAPVIIGQGERLFPETGPDRALELTSSTVMANGVTVQYYRPNGRPQYGPTTDTE